MRRAFVRQTFPHFVSLLLVSLSIAGCSVLGTTSTASPGNTMTLKVAQNNASSTCFLPLYVAQKENYFKDQGLTLDPPTPTQLGNGPKVAAALESGSIELAGGGIITDAFTLSRVDAQVKIVAGLSTGYTDDVIVSKRFAEQTHLTASSPLSDKVKALLGKKIGTTGAGTGTEALVIYLFRQFGYDPQKDATLVNIGNNSTAALTALSSGRVDAISFFEPIGQEAEIRGIGSMLISPDRGDAAVVGQQIQCVSYARQSVINAKPRAIQAYIRAIAQAETFIHKQPAQATALMEKYLNLDPQTNKVVFTATASIIPQSPRIDPKAYDAANQFHVKAGLTAVPLYYNDMVASDTINQALNGWSGS